MKWLDNLKVSRINKKQFDPCLASRALPGGAVNTIKAFEALDE